MSCRTPPQKLAWSFATNMFWDTDRAITRTTASGAKSESGSARPRVCHLSPSTPKPATWLRAIRAHKELRGSTAGLLVLAVCSFLTATALFSQTPSQAPPPIPGSTPNVPPPPGQSNAPGNNRIRSEVDLVVLRATVVGKDGNFVSGLGRDNFRVFEDKVEQRLTVFHQEDTPVTVGLVIDNSGSMREKRGQVNAAALRLVESSNPQDEVFVVNFN